MIAFTANSSVQFKKPTIKFNGGELHVTLQRVTPQIPKYQGKGKVSILACISSADDIMHLALVKSAVDDIASDLLVELIMPYIPYARQDRAVNEGEPFALKVFANMLNAMKFDKVTVSDPHSQVAGTLINKCFIRHQHELFRAFSRIKCENGSIEGAIIISPDKGATHKSYELAKEIGSDIIYATKKRNKLTGKLSTPSLVITQNTLELLKDKARSGRFVVVDDICDGGGTFIQLAELLKEEYGIKNLELLVTHGIFANGAKEKLKQAGYSEVSAIYDWTKDMHHSLNQKYWENTL